MARGIKTGGRVVGSVNKATIEFKEALNNLLTHAAPSMIKWLDQIAASDPNKALEHVGKLAEYIHAKQSRVETDTKHSGKVEHVVKWGE